MLLLIEELFLFLIFIKNFTHFNDAYLKAFYRQFSCNLFFIFRLILKIDLKHQYDGQKG